MFKAAQLNVGTAKSSGTLACKRAGTGMGFLKVDYCGLLSNAFARLMQYVQFQSTSNSKNCNSRNAAVRLTWIPAKTKV